MRQAKRGAGATVRALAAEVRKLRRDVDVLSVLHRIDDLTRRVSKLEFVAEGLND